VGQRVWWKEKTGIDGRRGNKPILKRRERTMMKHNKGNEMTPCRQQRKLPVLFEAYSNLLATKRDYVSFIDHQCFQISHLNSQFWTHVFWEGQFVHTFMELPPFAVSPRSSLALGRKKFYVSLSCYASCHRDGHQVK
jgi:hypothetical protein